jgi:hypothetical protein
MRLAAAVLIAMMPLVAQATTKTQKSAPAKQAAKAPAAPAKVGPPAGAEKMEEGKYRWKDTAGKTWIYKQTPFGWSRYEEVLSETAAASEDPGLSVLSETEDAVKFVKTTPFGKSSWERKKAELSAEEKAAYEKKKAAETASAK